MHKYFFEIPIYRLPPQKYLELITKYTQDYFDKTNRDLKRFSLPEKTINTHTQFYDYLRKVYGGPWQYNEIIGYIRLYTIPSRDSRVLGELWWVDAQRIVKTRKKLFIHKSYKCGFEISFNQYYKKTSSSIFQTLLEKIENIKKHRQFKKYYIDDSLFKSVGNFIDWNGILNEDTEENKGVKFLPSTINITNNRLK